MKTCYAQSAHQHIFTIPIYPKHGENQTHLVLTKNAHHAIQELLCPDAWDLPSSSELAILPGRLPQPTAQNASTSNHTTFMRIHSTYLPNLREIIKDRNHMPQWPRSPGSRRDRAHSQGREAATGMATSFDLHEHHILAHLPMRIS